jgi:hypothetical protein
MLLPIGLRTEVHDYFTQESRTNYTCPTMGKVALMNRVGSLQERLYCFHPTHLVLRCLTPRYKHPPLPQCVCLATRHVNLISKISTTVLL